MSAALKSAPFARILEVTEDEYFNDPCPVPSLSQSIANELLSKSPRHAWTRHPRLGKQVNSGGPDTEALDTEALAAGKIIHKLLLGCGAEIDVLDFDSYRTNAAKEARDNALQLRRVPMLRHKYEPLVEVAEALRESLASEHGVVLDGQSEIAFEWDERGERGPVRCRGRMDHIKIEQAAIFDVKKIRSAHPDMCRKHIEQFGYDIQWAAYTSALAKYRPEYLGRVSMQFLFMELDPPYAITPVTMSGQMREIGQMRWQRAVDLWSRCLSTGRWPAYTEKPISIEPSPWFMQREFGTV